MCVRPSRAWRNAADAFRNAIGGAAYEATHAKIEDVLKAAAKAAVGATLKAGHKAAIGAATLTGNVLDIAKETGRSPLDRGVLKDAAVDTFFDSLFGAGAGDKAVQALQSSGSAPQMNVTKSFERKNSLQDRNLVTQKLLANGTGGTARIRKIQGSSKNDKLSGTAEDNYLFGKAGNDTLIGQQGWDVLIGDVGNDRLVGGDGADMLNGCGKKFVLGEIDRLTGGAGVDIFVLGDTNQRYYDDRNRRTAGNRDYAVITDFNPNQDFIILKGKFSDYIFKRNKIFLNNDGIKGFSRNDELIAQVKGAANLSPVDIMFV